MDVNDTTAHEPQLVGPRGLCRLASLPRQHSPFAATPQARRKLQSRDKFQL